MRQGGIFNGMSAIGEIDETMDQIAEEWSRDALTPTYVDSGPITDWDSAADRAAIIAADQAILDAQKKAATPASSGGWAGLTDFQKLGIAVAGVLVVGAVWKGMKPSKSYASNPGKRRQPRFVVRRVGNKRKGKKLWGVYDRKRRRIVTYTGTAAMARDSADAHLRFDK